MKGGIRSAEADEIEGLDLPEMGALAYPEFEQIDILAEVGTGGLSPTNEDPDPEKMPV